MLHEKERAVYYIVDWDTGKTIANTPNLDKAKRQCRKLGHTGELAPNGRYPPVAYVADENGECIYNPVFRGTLDTSVKLILGKENGK